MDRARRALSKEEAVIIGKRLLKLRGCRTQKDIADQLGITPMAVSFYERGERVPDDRIKMKIAELFDSSVEDIFFTF